MLFCFSMDSSNTELTICNLFSQTECLPSIFPLVSYCLCYGVFGGSGNYTYPTSILTNEQLRQRSCCHGRYIPVVHGEAATVLSCLGHKTAVLCQYQLFSMSGSFPVFTGLRKDSGLSQVSRPFQMVFFSCYVLSGFIKFSCAHFFAYVLFLCVIQVKGR